MKYLKFLFIPIIALGLTLSCFFGVKYNCEGEEMFPIYYSSPFVFRKTSLGSSMEYYYSVAGLVLNVAVWSLVLIIIRYGILKLSDRVFFKKQFLIGYKILIGLLVVLSCLIAKLDYQMLGSGFDKHRSNWYWNLDKEAKAWGMKCKGEWGFFRGF